MARAWCRLGVLGFSGFLLLSLFAQLDLQAANPGTGILDLEESKEEKTPAQEDFQKGVDLLYQGKYGEAAGFLRRAIEKDPDRAEYQIFLARALFLEGKKGEAEDLLKAIVEEHPDQADAAIFLSEILVEKKDWKEVIRVLKITLDYRHTYLVHHRLAEAYYYQDNHKEALKNYLEAVKFHSKSARDHYQLGNIYLSRARYSTALEYYSKAASLGMDSGLLHFKMGTAYFNLKNYLGKVTTTEVKGETPGKISGGLFLIDQVPGKPNTFTAAPEESAIYHVQKAVDMGIDLPEVSFLKANIFYNSGHFDKALPLYEALQGKLKGDNLDLFHFYLGKTLFEKERWEESLEYFMKAAESNPKVYSNSLEEGYFRVALRLRREGDWKSCIHYLQEAIAISPRNPAYHLCLGNAYRELKEMDKAVVQWRLVLTLQPDHPEKEKLLEWIQ